MRCVKHFREKGAPTTWTPNPGSTSICTCKWHQDTVELEALVFKVAIWASYSCVEAGTKVNSWWRGCTCKTCVCVKKVCVCVHIYGQHWKLMSPWFSSLSLPPSLLPALSLAFFCFLFQVLTCYGCWIPTSACWTLPKPFFSKVRTNTLSITIADEALWDSNLPEKLPRGGFWKKMDGFPQ